LTAKISTLFAINWQKRQRSQFIIKQFGYPPIWTRKANFQTLIHIILEQQVSLASARAAMNKLKKKNWNHHS
jgi:DNA-3-methyladenine glycosylase II